MEEAEQHGLQKDRVTKTSFRERAGAEDGGLFRRACARMRIVKTC